MWRLFLVVVVDFFFFFFFSADEEDYSVSEAVRSSGRCCVCVFVSEQPRTHRIRTKYKWHLQSSYINSTAKACSQITLLTTLWAVEL